MKQSSILIIAGIMALSSCAPKISTTVNKNYPALDYREEVMVFGLQDSVPANSEVLGVIKVGDPGFASDCGWDVVIDKAKIEARKAGGNAIKITEHIPPSALGSSCHRITAKILKVENSVLKPAAAIVDSSLLNADYAILHIYRYGGVGALVSYDLHLGDTVICRVSNKWKKSIKIRKDGLNTLWAKTEAKEELPVNIKFGTEYYIRCSVTMGAFVGRPKLELVSNSTGKAEYQSVKPSKANKRDLITLNDGREIECIINSEDSDNVYFTIFKNEKELKTQMNRTKIKSIQRSE
ncbi:MAG: hypothetical protein IPN67_19635 [Bacteroidales bacterium]|nr:hypothetical protein [Bacteroidales bacterium]